MIEIALCLAIIGQDASELIEAIRGGAFGLNDLTNYVFAITNFWTAYNNQGRAGNSGSNGYTYASAYVNRVYRPEYALTNGAHVVGLLSTPEFVDLNGHPLTSVFNKPYIKNQVVAYVRSLSGLAAEKPPQNNQLMQQGTFTYRVLCVNAPMAADTNVLNNLNPNISSYSSYSWQLVDNLRELRLLYSWPQQPNGSVGPFRQSFRVSIAGRLVLTNDPANYKVALYVYQSDSFNTNQP